MKESAPTPASGWYVRLQGDDYDLSLWEASLKPPFDPWCERIPPDAEPLVLRSPRFEDSQTANETAELATILIKQLNGVHGIFSDTESVAFNGLIHIDDNGKRNDFLFAPKLINRSRFGINRVEPLDVYGNPLPAPARQPSAAQRWIVAADQNPDIADMLIFFGQADNWFDLYKSLELAERLVGGQHNLEFMLGSICRDYKVMRQTANFYRHTRHPRPQVPSTLNDARSLLNSIEKIVLDFLLKNS